MPRPRKYPEELLDRGVRLVFESGRPVAAVARDLGVHSEALRKRVRQAEADGGLRPDLPSSAEREEIKELRKEVFAPRQRDPEVGLGVFCQGARSRPNEVSAFIDERRETFGVEPICRTLEVSASAYYARRAGERSARQIEDERLLAVIEQTHASNYYAYGYRRTWKALRRAGESVGRDRVKRLMRAAGIQGAKRRGRPWRTTRPDPTAMRSPDLVDRNFTAKRPDELWVADLTYLRCFEGLVFFAFVIDVFSRRVVGWQLARHMRSSLVTDALRMALHRRAEGADVELVHHSHAGSQYTSIDFTQTLEDNRVLQSIGSVGDAYDNAMAESFVDSFKTELIADRVWVSFQSLELGIVEYVGWFNLDRLHESLGDVPPAEFESRYAAQTLERMPA